MDISLLSEQDLLHLRTSFLFRDIEAERVALLLSAPGCCLCSFAKDAPICEERMGMILSGMVQVHSLSGSRRLAMRVLRTGDFFGAAALFSDDGYITVLTCAEDCRIIFFTESFLLELMRQEFSAAENYIRFLSGRVRFLNRKIACLAAGSVEESLALQLLDCKEDFYYVESFTALAEELGVGRASLYRALDKLTEAGLIRRSLHGITILNRQRLETLAQ